MNRRTTSVALYAEQSAGAISARAASGREDVREAMRNENTGSPADRIEAIASRARDAQAIAVARQRRATETRRAG